MFKREAGDADSQVYAFSVAEVYGTCILMLTL